MAPATEAVVGAVPAAKSGVASATNTVARMVSGALGVAVIGSLVSSLYSNDVEGSLVGLPAEAQARGRGLGRRRQRDRRPAPSRRRAPTLLADDRRRLHAGDGRRPARRRGARRRHGRRRAPLPAGPRVRRAAQTRGPVDLRRRSDDTRQAVSSVGRSGGWTILAALVLGCGLLARASRARTRLPPTGPAPHTSSPPIERFVQDEMEAQRIPGLALGIVKNDRITYLRGFGKADDSGRPVTPRDALHHRLARASRSPRWRSCSSSRRGRSSSTPPCSATCRGSESQTSGLRARSPSATS